jgi:peptide deformylase
MDLILELPILTSPHPVLRQQARPLSFSEEKDFIQQKAQLLSERLRLYEGAIGLAAPQVGWSIRMFAMDVTGAKQDIKVWVNPVIRRHIGSKWSEEGCLSLPQKRYKGLRSKRIEVEAYDSEGHLHRWRSDGLEAICIQHEIDHLDGKLIEDDSFSGRVKK